ncbi:Sec-independent protein translocase protein TatB [Hydrogenimonas sp. SS33]|uniref:Sec-independent protein translocase protein TatB n=1 Tax=Hydrogenimonas leucolamina TaxID=2954236 RepID=UPI00336C0FC3
MFGMGLGELFLIAVVAILFLGPDKLPEAMVQIAKFFRSVKRTVNDAKSAVEEELKISELKEEALNYKKQLEDATHQLERTTTAGLTSLDDLTETIEEVKQTEERFEEEAESLKEQIEPKREVVTFPKKRRVNDAPQEAAEAKPESESKEKESHV